MRRDRELERRLLASADAPNSFARLVLARLDAHPAGAYLDARPVPDLLLEVGEEALDVAGWALLTRQALDTSDVPAEERARIVAALDTLVSLGAATFSVVNVALGALLRTDDHEAACDREEATR